MMAIKAATRRLIWKYWYPYVTHLTQNSAITFLNYGYIDPQAEPLKLRTNDEQNRLFIQLYHHVAGGAGLTGLEVMEVSCGHGGGASYIARYLQPKSMLGVDRNPKAVEFCRLHHTAPGLVFAQGDAEALQFDDHAFDAIINVEASHCYGDMAQFVNEVYRLLRPGGYFLFADFRPAAKQQQLHQIFAESGLRIIRKEDITPDLFKAIEANNEEKTALVQQLAPRMLHKIFMQFAAVEGSSIFEKFKSREMVYLSYVLQKPS